MKYIASILFVLVCYGNLSAQKDSAMKNMTPPEGGRIHGKLVDNDGTPLSYATVTLLRIDSSVINGDLTTDIGSFEIKPTGFGNFNLRIEYIGSATRFFPVTNSKTKSDIDLGIIKLSPDEHTLGTVEIIGEKRMMELKVDKKVFNVDKNITSAGGNASDVLQNIPSVSVDANGSVSLRGKQGVTILIDGKPATMFGGDAATAMQNIPAASIENIEIITNPSAKYDAHGTSGIINIVTKKNNKFGFNGNIMVGVGSPDKYSSRLFLSAKNEKFNFFISTGVNFEKTYNNFCTTNRYDKVGMGSDTQSYNTNEHNFWFYKSNGNTMGLSYDPNKNNSFSVSQSINFLNSLFKNNSNYSIYPNLSETGSPILHQIRNSDINLLFFMSLSSFSFKHNFRKKDEDISINASYSRYNGDRRQFYTTNIDSTIQNYRRSFSPIKEDAPTSGNFNMYSINADYGNPLFTKNGRFEMGVKCDIQFIDASLPKIPMIDSSNRSMVVDSSLLLTYNYKEQINAAYINWSDQFDKLSYQVGLRIEDAIYDGFGKFPKDTNLHTNFLNYFPSAFISYKFLNQQCINISYTRRINIPSFFDVLPFKDLNNPSAISMGNPGLIPEYISNFEFNYLKSSNKGNTLMLSGYYTIIENFIDRITQYITPSVASDLGLKDYVGNIVTRPVNLNHGVTIGIEGVAHLQLTKDWDATISANAFQNQLHIGNSDSWLLNIPDNSGFGWLGKINTSVKLPKHFTLQININKSPYKVIAQGTFTEYPWMDIAISKKLFKNKVNLVINCADIFDTHKDYSVYNLINYRETIEHKYQTRRMRFTLSYQFSKNNNQQNGSAESSSKRLRKPEETDREQNMKSSTGANNEMH